MAEPTPAQLSAQQAGTMSATDAAVAAVLALYATLNAALLIEFGKVIAATTAITPVGLLALQAALTRITRQHVAAVGQRVGPLLTHAFRTAYVDGIETATRNYRGGGGDGHPNAAAGIMSSVWKTHAEQSVEVIQASLVDDLRVVHANVLRAPDDLYRAVVARTTMLAVGDTGTTVQEAIGAGWADFVERGITGYTDRAGRRWPISTYTEMAVRTAGIRAFNEAYQSQLKSLGVRLYMVPDDGHPCPLCWPWQNRIISDQPDDRPWVRGTVADARAAGLFHPNCRHVLMPYFEDRSLLPGHPKEWGPEQQAAYDATQRLRDLERRARAQAAVLAHATDPATAVRAKANLTRTRAAIREHVEANGLVRRRHREVPRTS